MKIQILLPMLLAVCVLTAYSTSSKHPSRTVHPAGVQAVAVRSGPPGTPAAVPEAGELRALLEHSLVTGSNAHAFMELFAHSDTQFQEFIERALVNNDYEFEPLTELSAAPRTAPSPAPDSTLQK